MAAISPPLPAVSVVVGLIKVVDVSVNYCSKP